ncbi:hypothetical protein T439DRAFT_45885 [Meredithblackwellia eburnea MCA 4105]
MSSERNSTAQEQLVRLVAVVPKQLARLEGISEAERVGFHGGLPHDWLRHIEKKVVAIHPREIRGFKFGNPFNLMSGNAPPHAVVKDVFCLLTVKERLPADDAAKHWQVLDSQPFEEYCSTSCHLNYISRATAKLHLLLELKSWCRFYADIIVKSRKYVSQEQAYFALYHFLLLARGDLHMLTNEFEFASATKLQGCFKDFSEPNYDGRQLDLCTLYWFQMRDVANGLTLQQPQLVQGPQMSPAEKERPSSTASGVRSPHLGSAPLQLPPEGFSRFVRLDDDEPYHPHASNNEGRGQYPYPSSTASGVRSPHLGPAPLQLPPEGFSRFVRLDDDEPYHPHASNNKGRGQYPHPSSTASGFRSLHSRRGSSSSLELPTGGFNLFGSPER